MKTIDADSGRGLLDVELRLVRIHNLNARDDLFHLDLHSVAVVDQNRLHLSGEHESLVLAVDDGNFVEIRLGGVNLHGTVLASLIRPRDVLMATCRLHVLAVFWSNPKRNYVSKEI